MSAVTVVNPLRRLNGHSQIGQLPQSRKPLLSRWLSRHDLQMNLWSKSGENCTDVSVILRCLQKTFDRPLAWFGVSLRQTVVSAILYAELKYVPDNIHHWRSSQRLSEVCVASHHGAVVVQGSKMLISPVRCASHFGGGETSCVLT